MNLNDHQVSRISTYLEGKGILHEYLKTELIDQIASEVERRMTIGETFEEAFIYAREQFRIDELLTTQEVINRPKIYFEHKPHYLMLAHNYLRIAQRNIRKNLSHSLIILTGLSLGITSVILIMLFVKDELSFDDIYENSDRTFRIVETRMSADGEKEHVAYTSGPITSTLLDEYPEVESSTKLAHSWALGRMNVRKGEDRLYIGDFLFAEPGFFEVFNFKIISGDPNTMLTEPNSVVLTEKYAGIFFGDTDPLGKSIESEWFDDPMVVTGVIEDPPVNTHLDFSMLFSYVSLQQFTGWWDWANSWDSDGFVSYLVLNDPEKANDIALSDIYRGHSEDSSARQPYFQALTDVHFGSGHIENEINYHESNSQFMYMILSIGIFIIFIASINYVNLATAQSFRRTKEVGVRKVTGASRSQIRSQFLTESMIIAGIAGLISYALVMLLLPTFNTFFNKEIEMNLATNLLVIPGLILLVTGIGLLAGSYPAFYLSRLHSIINLKGIGGNKRGSSRLRQSLIVIQFAVSILLIISTIFIYEQLQFIRGKDLGFSKEHLVMVDINSGGVRSKADVMKEEFLSNPSVISVSVSSRVPGEWKNLISVDVLHENITQEPLSMNYISIDDDFLSTFNIDLLDGRNLDDTRLSDSLSVLVNKTAAELLGGNVIGSSISIPTRTSGGGRLELSAEAVIVGIVDDFHYRSLHDQVGPLILGHQHGGIQAIDYFTLKLQPGNIEEALSSAKAVHEKFDPIQPFEYNFLDDRIDDFYKSDVKTSQLFTLGAFISIFIACLGLYGLSAYQVSQRTKEIGIRKVLGASIPSILVLLSKNFLLLIGLAFLIAGVLSYIFINNWLSGFAYHINIDAATFVITALIVAGIALLTVSFQSIRTALTDPVNTLRDE